MKYRLYIDEVGNPDIESSDNPNHRFLSLLGVILELGYVETIVHPQMEVLKAKYFRSHPDEPEYSTGKKCSMLSHLLKY